MKALRMGFVALFVVGLLAFQGAPVLAPPAANAAECEGDECQGPPIAPEDPIPGTAVVEGPPNPPVHYPKVHKKNPHKPHSHKPHSHKHKRHHRGKKG
jgi:hypothetical protein